MKRAKIDPLLAHLQSFFDSYLRQVRGASPHTLRSYGNSLRLFFLYAAETIKSPVTSLRVQDIQAPMVLSFLAHVESKRSNQVSTRNCRLAAIRSFAQHLLREDFTRANQYRQILSISAKKSKKMPVSYLEPEEVRKLIAGINPNSSPAWLRDRALILFLYNTGARISEALAVAPKDLHLDRPRQVRIMGKGKKERYCPLWVETARPQADWIQDRPQ
jgi:integrase/recombinase XerD